MSKMMTFNDENFKPEIAEGVSLVDFWAPWCGPCRMIAPVVDELADEMDGKVKVGKINVDDFGAIAGSYGVMSIPTLIIFKNGLEIDRIVGVRRKQELIDALTKHL